MTVPKFRSAVSNNATAGADVTVAKPSGTVDTDILLAVGSSFGQTLAPPAGWTELYLAPTTNDFGVWWKRASGEGVNYTFVTTGGANPRCAQVGIVCYRDCPLDLSPTIGTVTKQTSTVCKGRGVIPPSQAALLVHVGGCANADGSGTNSSGPPGFKKRTDGDVASGASSCQVAIGDVNCVPYIATGDKDATLSISRLNWGGLVVLYQTPVAQTLADGRGRETLVELTHWDEETSAEVVERYSGRGVTFSGGEFYERRILAGVEIRQHAADRVAVGGIVATTISDILLSNRDGALDAVYLRMLAIGRSVVIKSVRITDENASDLGAGALASATTIFTGIVAAMTPDGVNMVLTVSDLGERLNVPLPLVSDQYPGTAGVGGGAELKGQTRPLTFGRVFNMLPQQLGAVDLGIGDGSLYTFEVHGRPYNSVVAVYERGVAMTDAGAATPIAGQYRWHAGGTFQLGFTPNGIITCTVKGDDPTTDIYANQHGEIITRMLTQFGPVLATSDLETSTFTDVDTVLPGEIGIHFAAGDRSSTREAVERVLRSGGIWLSGGRNGKLRAAMAMPFPAERLRLKEPDLLAVKPLALPAAMQPAPHTIDMETEINWNPLTDISSSVTGGTRRALAGPGRTVHSISTALQARQKTPRTWSLSGLWFSDTQGLARADQIRTWIEQGLVAFEVVTDRYPGVVELGMGCEIDSYPRYGLANGFAGIVAGWRERLGEGRVAMALIGSVPFAITEAADELREDGTAELREDGSFELRE